MRPRRWAGAATVWGMSADVSVVIPAYNPRAEWLDEAIRSAVDQVPPPLEVLVVDDGSRVPVEYDHPLVRVIRQVNAGVAGARNTGLREARGAYVAILDQDDYWLSGKLAAQVEAMREGAVLCSTGSRLLRDGRLEDWFYGQLTPGDYATLVESNRITACTALFRTDVARGVGGFPDIRFVDDWAMWMALARVGPIVHVPRPLAVYRLHDTNSSHDVAAMWRGDMKALLAQRSLRALVVAFRRTRYFAAATARGRARAARKRVRELMTAIR